MNDRFKVSNLLARRLGEHQVSLPALLRRAGLPAGFFQLGHEDANSFFRAFHLWEGTSPGEWRTRQRGAEVEMVEN